MKEVVIIMHSKRNKKKQDNGVTENEPGITIVRCPYLSTCRFGGRQAKQARTRCRGFLCRVNHWESWLVIGFKCQWMRKPILVEVKGDAIRQIPHNSSEHQEVLPQLKQLHCQSCKHRILDYYVVYGDANIDVKCSRDGLFSSHFIK